MQRNLLTVVVSACLSILLLSIPALLLQTATELWWLSGSKEGILSELLRAVLCTTVVHKGMHTNMSSS